MRSNLLILLGLTLAIGLLAADETVPAQPKKEPPAPKPVTVPFKIEQVRNKKPTELHIPASAMTELHAAAGAAGNDSSFVSSAPTFMSGIALTGALALIGLWLARISMRTTVSWRREYALPAVVLCCAVGLTVFFGTGNASADQAVSPPPQTKTPAVGDKDAARVRIEIVNLPGNKVEIVLPELTIKK